MTKAAKVNPWPRRICGAWQKGIDAIFETGEALIAAKKDLQHGQFERMVESDKVPFSLRTAQALMKIAADIRLQRLRKAHHGALLPPSWRTLEELTRLTAAEFRAAVKSKLIHSEMQRNDIASFRLSHLIATRPAAPQPEPRTYSLNIVRTAPEPTRYTVYSPVRAPDRVDEPPESPELELADRLVEDLAQANDADIAAVVDLVVSKQPADFRPVLNAVEKLLRALEAAASPVGALKPPPWRPDARRRSPPGRRAVCEPWPVVRWPGQAEPCGPQCAPLRSGMAPHLKVVPCSQGKP